MRRIVVWVSVAAVAIVLISSVAVAATPGFELDVEHDAQTLVVTVTFEPVPSDFAWATMEASGVLDQLVGVLPADQVDDNGRPTGETVIQLVPLERVSEGVYEGRAVVPHDGEWAVVAWPMEQDLNPPVQTVIVAVGGDVPALVWVTIGIVTIVLLASLARRAKHQPGEPAAASQG